MLKILRLRLIENVTTLFVLWLKNTENHSLTVSHSHKNLLILFIRHLGPYRQVTIHGERYFIKMVDDLSRFTWVSLKDKSEGRSKLQSFYTHVQIQ